MASSDEFRGEFGDEFHIVGIGASAGGLRALEQFFRQVPDDCPAAFVVVQHLSPDFDSLMDELLARHTKLSIHKVADGAQIESGSIYLIPPRFDMTIENGRLHLNEQTLSKGIHLPIDIFFESLARAVGERAVSVILSGSGADGTRGIQHIHTAGGLVVVQEPTSAEFDSMPRRALATGIVDLQLRPEEMGAIITNHIHGLEPVVSTNADNASDSLDELSQILEVLREHYRVDFQAYKLTTLVRRLERRLMLRGINSLEEYIELLRTDLQEVDALYRDFLVEVTDFFRDPEAFDVLHQKGVIDELVRSADKTSGLRAWIPGCATGQEAYTLAMLLDTALGRSGRQMPIKIFATDVHPHSLSIASTGYYEQKQLSGLPQEYVHKYFRPSRNGFQVNANLRQTIVFAPHDLTQDPPFTQIDLVSCRNVLIYFTESSQSRILENLHYSLKLNGYMILGPSEHLGVLDKEFTTINARWRIFRKVRNTQFRRYSSFASISQAPTVSSSPSQGKNIISNNSRQWQEALLERYIPTGFLVDGEFNLIYTFGDAGKFLEPPSGTSTLNLLRMMNHEFGLALRAAIFRAQKEKKTVIYSGVNWMRTDESKTLSISAKPVFAEAEESQFYMLELREETARQEPVVKSEPYSVSGQTIEQVQALEQELLYAKEHLQMTIEELETTNEELQSTNEELVASNEELQSTNEELHSVNEELYTVNAEYQRKIDELVQITSDMRVLEEHTHVGVVFLDVNMNIRSFTSASARVFDLLPQDIGRPLSHLLYNIDLSRQEFLASTREVMQTSNPVVRDINSNSGHFFEMSILPYITGEEITGVVLTFIDNSELRAQQQTAERHSKELAVYQNMTQIAILQLDIDESIAQINDVGCQLVGHHAEEIIGQPWRHLFVPDLRTEAVEDKLKTLFHHTSEDESTLARQDEVELAFVDPSGKEKIVSWTKGILRDGSHRVSDIMLFGRDVTEVCALRVEVESLSNELQQTVGELDEARRHVVSEESGLSEIVQNQIKALEKKNTRLEGANAALEKENHELARSNSELDSFVHIASHDLREPLRNIAQYARFLEEDHQESLKEDGMDMLNSIRMQSDHLASLLDDLRTYSVINRSQEAIRPTDLNQLVQSVLEQLAALISESNAAVTIQNTLPTVVCSATHVSTVFQNLIANAIKYNNKSEKRVEIRCEEQPGEQSGEHTGEHIICVSDNGIGIDERYTERIFEMFRRLHGQNEFGGGTGAGLAIVKKYLESTGGQIWLESEVGVGTTFFFTIGNQSE